jgi:hypothetical protein
VRGHAALFESIQQFSQFLAGAEAFVGDDQGPAAKTARD